MAKFNFLLGFCLKRLFLILVLFAVFAVPSFGLGRNGSTDLMAQDKPVSQSDELNPRLVPCVTLIYGTDRVPRGADYGNQADNQIHWGQCRVALQLAYRRNKNPRSKWLEFMEPQGLPVPGVSIVVGTGETTADLRGAESSNKTFVFIHGFGTSFKNASLRMAKIAYDLQLEGTPILYSWPSRGSISVSDYRKDTATVESKEEIDRCVEFLEEVLSHSASGQVDLLAHSMGTHLLCEALGQINPKFISKIGSIVLIAPDISAKEFTRLYLQEDGLKNRYVQRGHPILVYSNEKDQALGLSQYLTGEKRLGQGGGMATILEGLTVIDCTQVAIDWGSNHELDQHDPVIDDMYLWLRQGIGPDKRLLTLVPKDGGGYFESFEGVKSIKNPTDYGYMLGAQFGALDNVFKFGVLSDDRHWQLEGGIDKGFLPSQVDLRMNVLTDVWRPYLLCGYAFYNSSQGGTSIRLNTLFTAVGLEWFFNEDWAASLECGGVVRSDANGPAQNDSNLNTLIRNDDFPWNQIHFQICKYFDIEI